MPAATPLAPTTLVTGDEELLVSRAVAEVVAAARERDPQVEVSDRAPGEFGDGDMLDLSSPSMFGGLRVVVVRAAQDLPDPLRDALVAYAGRPLPDVVLVVVHTGARNKKLVDALKVAGARVVSAARVTRPKDRQQFVVAEVRRRGGRVTDAAARALVDAVGSELRELAAVCHQLVADTGGVVDETAVARYHRGRAETTGFAVADAAIAGDLGQALTLLRQALDRGTAPVLVCS
ncbi:MAG TPA: DNA polymerase III subunit delta, partial [Frankiaceae bacterium]|nr:DNA polymerase III subunit delta [Frankiaceae bacterium]